MLLSGGVGSTFALWQGQVDNAGSSFGAGWVGAPAGLSADASGYDVDLAWTAGTHGPVTGQELLGVDNGTDQDCTGAAYDDLGSLSATASSYTDSNRGGPSTDGDWFCYEVESTSATVWTAQTDPSALQLGLAATAVTVSNGGTAGHVDLGDTITITFNQRTTVTAGITLACVFSSGVIVLGDTNVVCSNASDPNSIGKLTLSGATITGNLIASASTVAVSSSAPWTVTITLGAVVGSSTVSGSPTWTFVPASTIETHVTTDQAAACTAAQSTCRPTTTTSF